jgi:hypothetical protein
MKFFKHKHGEAQERYQDFLQYLSCTPCPGTDKNWKILNEHSSMDRKIDERLTAIVLAFPLLNR